MLSKPNKEQGSWSSQWRLLADRLRGLWLWFGTSVALAYVGLALQLVTPLVLAAAIDQIISGTLSWGVQAYVAVAVAALLAEGFGRIADVKWHARLNFRLATDTLAKGLTLGLPGRARFERGDLIYRSVGDVGGAAGLPQSFVTVSTGLLLAVGSVAALAFLHPSFVVAWFLCLVVATLVTKRVFGDLGKRQSALSSHNGRMVSLFLDALRGARTIEASNTVEREVERVCRPLRDLADGARDMEVVGGKGMAVMLLSGHGVVIATTCVGAVLLTRDAISLGMLLAALTYSRQAFSAAAGVLDNGWFHIAIGRSHAGRVAEVLDSAEATPAPVRPMPLPSSSPASVCWNGVGVRPADVVDAKGAKGVQDVEDVQDGKTPQEGESDAALLRNVHLAAPAEQTLALVGASGVGKTTLVSLVGRLLDPDEGEVSVADTPVYAVPRRALADHVAYAFEKPNLIGTVAESITLGRPASPEAVRLAAARAAADEFIERLPQGYETPVADISLSGGERQRLGLARAFLALEQTAVLVLDDATSHLDMATEARISAILLEQAQARTTLMVAHRASMAARADAVAWLRDGTIEAVGTHAELLAKPAYRELFDVA